MIVPRHKICDICKESVGINKRYYIIKSKCIYVGYGGSASDNRTHHICEDCMTSLISLINEKEKNDGVQDMKNLYNYVYPAIFTPEDNGAFSIRFPDIENCFTCGDDIKDGMLMAEDALALMVYTNYEETGKPAPVSTPIKELKLKKGEFATYIVCNTTECRRKFGTKAVKKTLTIPEWLNEAAIKERINFSRVLQDALIEKLNVCYQNKNKIT